MKTHLVRTLLLCSLLSAPGFAQGTLPGKKVVFTSSQRLSESDIRELRLAAPSLNIVFPARDALDKEIVDADGRLDSDGYAHWIAPIRR